MAGDTPFDLDRKAHQRVAHLGAFTIGQAQVHRLLCGFALIGNRLGLGRFGGASGDPGQPFDLRRNIPAAETTILATTATLVANSTLHPDSARQLLTAAIAVHSDGGYFEDEGEFPSALNTELPVPETVTSFLERGPIGLERYLPISVAALVERILFVILPLLLFLYPLLRSTPSAYSFAIRYRIFRWYQRVRRAEADMGNYSLAELESEIRYLEGLEEQITERVKVPLFYQSDFYQLRMHLRLVIERLIARRAVLLGESEPSAAISAGPPEMPGTDADKIDFDHTHATE